jgi:hypothetical protein
MLRAVGVANLKRVALLLFPVLAREPITGGTYLVKLSRRAKYHGRLIVSAVIECMVKTS